MDSLHDDLYFVLFSFLQDKVTFIVVFMGKWSKKTCSNAAFNGHLDILI